MRFFLEEDSGSRIDFEGVVQGSTGIVDQIDKHEYYPTPAKEQILDQEVES